MREREYIQGPVWWSAKLCLKQGRAVDRVFSGGVSAVSIHWHEAVIAGRRGRLHGQRSGDEIAVRLVVISVVVEVGRCSVDGKERFGKSG